MRNKRFVLDPNIYISYFISRNQNDLALLAIKHKLEFVICEELVTEFKRVLGYPSLAKFEIEIRQAVKFGDDDILSEKKNLEKKYKKLRILTKTEFGRMFT